VKRGASELDDDDVASELDSHLARVEAQERSELASIAAGLAHCFTTHLKQRRTTSVAVMAHAKAMLDELNEKALASFEDAYGRLPTHRKQAVAAYRRIQHGLQQVEHAAQRLDALQSAAQKAVEEEARRADARRQAATKALEAEQQEIIAQLKAKLSRIDGEANARRQEKKKQRRGQPPPQFAQILSMLSALNESCDD